MVPPGFARHISGTRKVSNQMENRRFAKAGAFVAGAVVVFVICSVVQAAGDSSMFSTTYAEPDSAFLDLAMNMTFWPGWLVTAALLLAAGRALFDID